MPKSTRLLVIANIIGKEITALLPEGFDSKIVSRLEAQKMDIDALSAFDVIFIAHCTDDPEGMEGLYRYFDQTLKDQGRYVACASCPEQVHLPNAARLVTIIGPYSPYVQNALAEAVI